MNKLITTVVVLLATSVTSFSQVKEVMDVKRDTTRTVKVITLPGVVGESAGAKKVVKVEETVAPAVVEVPVEKVVEPVAEATNAYSKNGFTVAGLLGYNGYTLQGAEGIRNSYESSNAYKSWVNQGLQVGVEGGWFVADYAKITLELGFNHAVLPGYSDIPGTSVDASKGGIPSFGSVANRTRTMYRMVAGFNKYLKLKGASKLVPYYGGSLGLSHGIEAMKSLDVTSQGMSYGESFSTKVAAVAGVEYNVSNELYFGLQINPLAFNYNVTSIKPIPGVAPLQSDAFEYTFLASPTLRLGFRF